MRKNNRNLNLINITFTISYKITNYKPTYIGQH